MGHVTPTPAGNYRANWRDPSGKQKAKTFKTKREAKAYIAEMEGSKNRGVYVDPDAGKIRFEDFAARWLLGREVEARTAERTLSLLRTHLVPRWGRSQLNQIDFMSIQEWVVDLGRVIAPPTVSKCYGLLLAILETAVRARVLPYNPAEGVRVRTEARDRPPRAAALTRGQFFRRLLPAVPARHRAMVATAAGAGLRWGECAGLVWGAVDLDTATLRVVQVAVETPQGVTMRPYPKTKAGVRTVPLPGFLMAALTAHRGRLTDEPEPGDLVFPNRFGLPMLRSNFRREVWTLALARAGLPASLRFHDLRHSYATWLVTDGVPVNAIQRVMGHANASTTLNRYTHAPTDYADRVRDAFAAHADDSLTFSASDHPNEGDGGVTPVPLPA
ncbi:site-specific recombinase XerD [Krasilnikovia cinnamomea]|uniref:Site-specific recombinase XerD n=1 Tax=Krasilnikovia cinnamomea TaxID=349313 RepID=A0A4Q7ZKR2_9ACTN|nr:site-specific integrase [Krasilnikovia cinnamomea]RZU51528.1 site-specific recombinase XerD [Krasilnikovia cinnamomea]